MTDFFNLFRLKWSAQITLFAAGSFAALKVTNKKLFSDFIAKYHVINYYHEKSAVENPFGKGH
jgi:hypothetical protein